MTVSDFPNSFPSITLDFRNSQKLDPRITATRATTGTYIRNGLVETAPINVPRFQQGEGLLIEQSRTNQVLRSQEFDNAAWSRPQRTSVTANAGVAPDGTTTADLMFPNNSAGATCDAFQNFGNTAGDFSGSVFAKASGKNWLRLTGAQGNSSAWFNLATGIIGTVQAPLDATITRVGNGWFRCSVSQEGATANFIFVTVCDDDNSTAVTTNGNDGLLVWGAQFEQGAAHPTSYIPTTTATVTRAADNVSIPAGEDFNSWWNQGPGTFVTNACRITGGSAQNCVISVTDGTATNRLEIRSRELTDTDSRYFITGTGLGVFDVSSLASNENVRLQALTYGPTNGQAALNGESDGNSVGNNLTGVPVLTNVFFGNNNFAFQNRPQFISNMSYYPVRVTDEEVEALTQT